MSLTTKPSPVKTPPGKTRPVLSGASRGDRSPEVDLVGRYLREVGATPLLTAAQEVELARRIEAGVYAAGLLRHAGQDDTTPPGTPTPLTPRRRRDLDAVARDGEHAKDHMIRANLRLVVSVARKHSSRGLPFPDLIQEGNLGLIRAVEKFDHTKGFKFSTYAVWWIRQAVERGLADQTRTVRLPVHVVEELSRVRKAERRLRAESEREPTAEQVAEAVEMPLPRVVELRRAGRDTISLETPVGHDGNTSVADLITDTDATEAHEAVERQAVTRELHALLDTLPERQARIMTRRYGLVDGRARTLQEVADEIGLTKERIRQLEKESLTALRDPERNRALLALTD